MGEENPYASPITTSPPVASVRRECSWSVCCDAPESTLRESGPVVALSFFLVIVVTLLWVSLAVSVKRWHDRDKSGWWVLLNLNCSNNYGRDPT